MKAKLLIPGLLGGLLCVQTAAQAQNRPGPNDRPGGQPNIRELFLKQFDKNGNGRIEENERPSREQIQDFFRKQQSNQTTPGRPGGRPGAGDPNQRPGGPGERPGQRPGGRPGEPGQGGQGGRPGFGGPGQGGFPGGPGGRPGGAGREFPPRGPLAEALDANRDGVISAVELKNASRALAKLDRNGDGKITREEYMPAQRGGQGGRPGFGGPGQGPDRPDGFRRPGGPGPGQGRPDGFRRPNGPGQGQGRPDGFRRPNGPGQGPGRPDGFRRPGGPGQGRPDGPTNPNGPRPGRPDRSEA